MVFNRPMQWNEGRRLALEALKRSGCGDNDDRSVMRMFLESDHEFTWPNGSTDYTVPLSDSPELTFNKYLKQPPERLLDVLKRSKKASLKQYRCDIENYKRTAPEMIPFKHAFAVKTLRDEDVLVSNSNALQEIEKMRRLFHPHVAAFLGTYTIGERLSFLIYPAACCDLQHFMDSISRDIKMAAEPFGPQPEREGFSRQGMTLLYPTAPQNQAVHDGQDGESEIDYLWPLKMPLSEKLRALHGFYYCILSALAYLYKQAVRHRDVKPANILIDMSGSIVFTDFGISKRFEVEQSQTTEDGDAPRTPAYAAPECHDKTSKRNEKSDIFSAGCVFVEMASLELGFTLEATKFYRQSCYFHPWALKKVQKFINVLIEEANSKATDPIKAEIATMLPTLRTMLQESPSARWSADKYLPTFSFASTGRCRDCHKDHEDLWVPTELQRSQQREERRIRRSSNTVWDDTSEMQERVTRSYLRLPSPPLHASLGGSVRSSGQIAMGYQHSVATRRMSTPLSNQIVYEDTDDEPNQASAATLRLRAARSLSRLGQTNGSPPLPRPPHSPQRALTFTPTRLHYSQRPHPPSDVANESTPSRASSSSSRSSSGTSTPISHIESDSWVRVDEVDLPVLPEGDHFLPRATEPRDSEKVILLDISKRAVEKISYRYVKAIHPDCRIDIWDLDPRLSTFIIPAEGETGGVFRLDLSECFNFRFNAFSRRFRGRYSKLCVVGRSGDVISRPAG